MSTVEQIKSRLHIVDVVQTYVKLQQAGTNYKANCPFHSERTPSFFVSPTRESWHCFGCSRGGDMFSFVMEIEGVEFYEALKILADKAGIEIQKINKTEQSERQRLISLLEESAKFFQAELKKNQDVIDYLKKRGMKGETAKAFQIGFAPAGWRNLFDHLKGRGYSAAEMEKSGMIIKSSSDLQATSYSLQPNYHDRFRSRVMFPLANASGQIVGFSGRIFGDQPADSGKYINTPQTILYDKSRLLYGFDKAKNDIRRKDFCVIVEGQMDVVMSHQAGVINTVAVSGTALTGEHLKLIKRLTDKLVMAFDRDEAGARASGKGIDMALAEGFQVKAAVSPSGKDPADAVMDDPESWVKAVTEAKNVIDFYLETLVERKDVENRILPYIAILPSAIEKAQWAKKIADKFRVAEEAVWEEIKKAKPPIFDKTRGKEENYGYKKPLKKTRLEVALSRLLGFALWQKNSSDAEIKSLVDEVLTSRESVLSVLLQEEKDRLGLEAELNFEGCSSLKDEILKLKKDSEKEEIKMRLEEITGKIRELELVAEGGSQGGESKLDSYLSDFHDLTKKLNQYQ
ncbi:DNA primase [Candidatus Parcubacteria bacterium]|nr:MAG: DNA primase [Candidatus Parcubacteria bacterium]